MAGSTGSTDLFLIVLVGLIAVSAVIHANVTDSFKSEYMELRREFAVVVLDMWQENATCHAVFRIDRVGLGYPGAESLHVYLIIAEKNGARQVFKPAYGLEYVVVRDVDIAEFVANGTCLYYPSKLDVKAEALYRNGEIIPVVVPVIIPSG